MEDEILIKFDTFDDDQRMEIIRKLCKMHNKKSPNDKISLQKYRLKPKKVEKQIPGRKKMSDENKLNNTINYFSVKIEELKKMDNADNNKKIKYYNSQIKYYNKKLTNLSKTEKELYDEEQKKKYAYLDKLGLQ